MIYSANIKRMPTVCQAFLFTTLLSNEDHTCKWAKHQALCSHGTCNLLEKCSRLNNDHPKDIRSHPLESVNVTLFGKVSFPEVAKWRILRWRDYLAFIRASPKCNHMHTYKRETEGDLTQTEEEKATWPQGQTLQWSSHKPRNSGSYQRWKKQGMHSPLEILGERWPCKTLDFGPVKCIWTFLAWRTVGK